jgi:hypothetical protein
LVSSNSAAIACGLGAGPGRLVDDELQGLHQAHAAHVADEPSVLPLEALEARAELAPHDAPRS